MSFLDGEPQKRLTFRVTDPAGYLIFEINVLVPASMVRNIQTDWINTLKLKAAPLEGHMVGLESRIDVVLK